MQPEEIVARAPGFSAPQKAFLADHPPGLVRALWQHFAQTRDRCGCRTPSHERSNCQVLLIQRLLLDEESA